jgi:uncharacterized protein YjbJ (UPF0337 family)
MSLVIRSKQRYQQFENTTREGQLDQVVGKVKEKAAKIAKKVKKTVERAADTMKDA